MGELPEQEVETQTPFLVPIEHAPPLFVRIWEDKISLKIPPPPLHHYLSSSVVLLIAVIVRESARKFPCRSLNSDTPAFHREFPCLAMPEFPCSAPISADFRQNLNFRPFGHIEMFATLYQGLLRAYVALP